MNKKNMLIILVLAVLIVISAVQAVQLSGLKGQLSSGDLQLGSSSANTQLSSHSASSGAIPTNLQDLPQMVGGC